MEGLQGPEDLGYFCSARFFFIYSMTSRLLAYRLQRLGKLQKIPRYLTYTDGKRVSTSSVRFKSFVQSLICFHVLEPRQRHPRPYLREIDNSL